MLPGRLTGRSGDKGRRELDRSEGPTVIVFGGQGVTWSDMEVYRGRGEEGRGARRGRRIDASMVPPKTLRKSGMLTEDSGMGRCGEG